MHDCISLPRRESNFLEQVRRFPEVFGRLDDASVVGLCLGLLCV